jgi:hypothetical protein
MPSYLCISGELLGRQRLDRSPDFTRALGPDQQLVGRGAL